MKQLFRWSCPLVVCTMMVPCVRGNEVEAAANQAEQAPTPPPAVAAEPAVGSWHVREVDGIEYLPLEDLRSFYKLMPMQPKGRKVAGQRLLGNGEITLTFGPEPRELRIQDKLCYLSHAVHEDASGDLLVSRIDVLNVIEPVLRPTYIANRSAVRTVVIDPGHGGHDTGTVTPYAREADVALVVATKLGAELKKRGYEVVYTQEHNQYVSPQGRVDKANATPAAIFVSLHLNNGRSDMKGSQVYSIRPVAKGEKPLPGHEYSQASMALAMALQSSLVEKAETADGGCRRAHYSPLNSLHCPGVIVELGYASNPEEGTRLATEEYQLKLVSALALGVDSFARVMNPATTLQVQKAPEVEAPAPAPVKVDPAPVKKAKETKKAQPRKKAPRRRAPAPRKKNRNRRR